MFLLLFLPSPGHQTLRRDIIPVTCHASLALLFFQHLLGVENIGL